MEFARLSRSFADSETFRVNQVQYAILSYLSGRDDIRLTAMSEKMGYDLSVLSRQASALAEQGLVTRTKDPHDGRAWILTLTDQGLTCLVHARAKRLDVLQTSLAAYSDQERDSAARILISLNQVLKDTLKRKGIPLG